MLTTCTQCQTKFSIPEDSVSVGDMVQCCVCDYKWAYAESSDLSRAEAPISVDKLHTTVSKRSVKVPNSVKSTQPEKTKSWTSRAFFSVVVVLTLVIVLCVTFRTEIKNRFPLSVPAYKYVDVVWDKTVDVVLGKGAYVVWGKAIDVAWDKAVDAVWDKAKETSFFDFFDLTVKEQKIEAKVVKAVLSNMQGNRILTIKGLVHNVSKDIVQGVSLNTELRDNAGTVMQTVTFTLNTRLKAGQAEVFKVTIPEPPKNATDVQVRVSE